MGGVLSHNPALATLGQLPGPLLFHTVCMVLGALCMTARPKAAAPAAERV